ncbi:hypothetical protein DXG03_006864, partial [Asterophora parasitica]
MKYFQAVLIACVSGATLASAVPLVRHARPVVGHPATNTQVKTTSVRTTKVGKAAGQAVDLAAKFAQSAQKQIHYDPYTVNLNSYDDSQDQLPESPQHAVQRRDRRHRTAHTIAQGLHHSTKGLLKGASRAAKGIGSSAADSAGGSTALVEKLGTVAGFVQSTRAGSSSPYSSFKRRATPQNPPLGNTLSVPLHAPHIYRPASLNAIPPPRGPALPAPDTLGVPTRGSHIYQPASLNTIPPPPPPPPPQSPQAPHSPEITNLLSPLSLAGSIKTLPVKQQPQNRGLDGLERIVSGRAFENDLFARALQEKHLERAGHGVWERDLIEERDLNDEVYTRALEDALVARGFFRDAWNRLRGKKGDRKAAVGGDSGSRAQQSTTDAAANDGAGESDAISMSRRDLEDLMVYARALEEELI